MTEPVRWLEDPSGAPDGARELLAAGRATPALPASVRAATAASLASGAAAGGLGLGFGKVAAILCAVTLALGLGGATFWAQRARHVPPPERAAVSVPVTVAPVVATLPHPADAPAPAPAPIHAGPAPHAPPARVAALTPAPMDDADQLAAEAALLEEARAALPTSPSRALSLASTHARRFRDPQLGAERELVAIDALARLGRLAEARRRAHALAVQYPQGLYAARAARILERAAPQ